MTEEKKNQTDIEELIFAKKNKEYGAYKLRKAYKTYLALAMWIAIFVVLMVTTGPAVYRMINPETVEVTKKRVVQITQLEQPPSIGEQKEIEQVEAPPPLKSTIKFTPPVVKPDEQVKDEYIPTVDELKEVDPGTETQEGNPEGVDYSLIEVEEKVVEKEEAPTYFVAVEEMPEPIGGIKAIQERISYPEIAKRAGVEGKVYILAFVNENGDVTKAQILKGIGAGCDEAARDAVLQTKFKPGKQRGVPVKVQVSIPIVFKLQ
ncbi:MAG: cell envelope biogenesis protein TonB [Ignavibacteriaceae bacterium]|nr:TonB family protein [Ignavibacteria bacterium]GIK61941.1 MAG: cell envelope biogenesis protein TonB [Ignavibacteriota bacterium]GJQ42782.1 MAG: cell envelope biogenesis protein TonB [Ignavibacteriaceae bacterium]